MIETEIGRYSRREYAEREALSIQEDAPEGFSYFLRITDSGEWALCELVSA